MPNFDFENKYPGKIICGVDEAGLGPLAGPIVVAACVISNRNMSTELLKNIDDSKKLSHKKREHLFDTISISPDIHYAISVIDSNVIDEIGLSKAWQRGISEAIGGLSEFADVCLIDGNRSIPTPDRIIETIVKGDQKSYSIATASIIAKVTRDRIMQEIHKEYPNYGFDKHVGYGTKLHLDMLGTHGACPYHRRTYSPVKRVIELFDIPC